MTATMAPGTMIEYGRPLRYTWSMRSRTGFHASSAHASVTGSPIGGSSHWLLVHDADAASRTSRSPMNSARTGTSKVRDTPNDGARPGG